MITKLRTGIYFLLSLANVFLKKQPHIIILSYHSISQGSWQYGVSFVNLQKQIALLEKDYQFITLDDLQEFFDGKKMITQPSVIITFDDGYKDIMETKSFFENHHIFPALFVLANPDKANREELDSTFPLLDKREITALRKAGWIIGSHTNIHPDLSKSKRTQLEKEIEGSKKSLEKDFGIAVNYFAYPKGIYTDEAVATVKKAEYTMAVTVDDDIITKKTNQYLVPRITVTRTHTTTEFNYMISPAGILFRKFLKQTGLGKLIS